MNKFLVRNIFGELIEAETCDEAEEKYRKKHKFSKKKMIVSQKALNPHGKYY